MDEDKKPIEKVDEQEVVTPRQDDEPQKEKPLIESDLLPEMDDSTQPPVSLPVAESEKPQGGRFKRFLKTKKGKFVVILASILIILGVLWFIPVTRYGILGTVIKRKTPVVVIDSATKKPVTEASIALGNLSAKTDNEGKVTLQDVPVGEYTLKITKNYYTTAEIPVTVPVFGDMPESKIDLVATGRQVSVMLIDTITKKPLDKAAVIVGETSSIADANGIATIVLPADQEVLSGQVKLDGYNTADVQVRVTDQADANKFSLTSNGTLYFLSKQTGKINVMKSNLDGTAATVAVKGTGTENDNETALLAARDWQYLALSAKRKAAVAGQLYLVDAKTNTLKTIDEGNVSIELVGWSDHNFLYTITRNEKKLWEDKRQALKSYNADTGAVTTLDETYGVGTTVGDAQYELISNPYIVEGKVVYVKPLYREFMARLTPTERKSSIVAVSPANGQKQILKDFTSNTTASLQAKLYEPQELYFRVTTDNSPVVYFEYEAGAIKSVTNTDEKFYNTFYPTFLVSPDSQKTLWHEPRNGKNAIFVGDKNGKNSREIATGSEYATYGWFSDNYILLSKNGSELYIASVDGQLGEVTKIASYHKATLNFSGYGYGYGGL